MEAKTILYILGGAVLLIIAGLTLVTLDSGNNLSSVSPAGSSTTALPISTTTINATASIPAATLTVLRPILSPFPPGFFDPSKQSPVTGAPAIQPKIKVTNSSTPTFTAQDVKDYIAANPDRPNKKAEVPPTIDKVEFVTYQEYKTRPGIMAQVNISNDRLLCLVAMSGRFTIYGPPVGGAAPRKITDTKENLVFDAQTGNILPL